MKRIAALLAVLLMCFANGSEATTTFTNAVTAAPSATTPFAGTELIPVIQSGVTKSFNPYVGGPGNQVVGNVVSTIWANRNITGTTGTITSADCAGRVGVTSTTGSAISITGAGSLPAGCTISVVNDGAGSPPVAGSVTLTPTSGNICGNSTLTLTSQGSGVDLRGDGSGNFVCSGTVAAGSGTSGSFLSNNTTTGGNITIGRNDATLANGSVIGTIYFTGNDATGTAVTWGAIKVTAVTTTGGTANAAKVEYLANNGSGLQDSFISNASSSGQTVQMVQNLNVGSTTTGSLLAVGGNGTSRSAVSVAHINCTYGSTTTVAGGTGAGTSPTITLTASPKDCAFNVDVVAGTTPSINAPIFTITFGSAGTLAPVCTWSPGGSHAQNAAALVGIYPSPETTTTFILNVGATGLVATTDYSWNVHCIFRG